MSWYEQVSEHGVAAVARSLGLQVGGGSGNVNRGISPCPSCGAEQRGRRDRRGPIGIRPDDRGWRCHRCDAHGDPVNLAAWVLLGVYKPTDSSWGELQTTCADAGLCDSPTEKSGYRSRMRIRKPCPDRKPPRPAARVAPAPIRPPIAEVLALWDTCRPVTSDMDVAGWLIGRGLQPEICAAQDVVRALPSKGPLPSWATFGRPWTQSSHRVIIPMYGPTGMLETLHARALAPRDPKGRDKAASPKGAQVAGSIMANGNGVALLGREQVKETSAARSKTYTLTTKTTILIAEGVPDFLTWATHYSDDESAPVVLGIISGSWSDAIAERVPDDSRVLIRTHADKAGHKYAHRIRDSLRDRCQVFSRREDHE